MNTSTEAEIRDTLAFLQYRDTYAKVMHEFLGWPLAQGRQHVDRLVGNESFRYWFGHSRPVADAAVSIVSARLNPNANEGAGGSILYREVCATRKSPANSICR